MQLFLFMRINLEKLHNGPLNKIEIVFQKVCMHTLFIHFCKIIYF